MIPAVPGWDSWVGAAAPNAANISDCGVGAAPLGVPALSSS